VDVVGNLNGAFHGCTVAAWGVGSAAVSLKFDGGLALDATAAVIVDAHGVIL